jgi:hypothetical protein
MMTGNSIVHCSKSVKINNLEMTTLSFFTHFFPDLEFLAKLAISQNAALLEKLH